MILDTIANAGRYESLNPGFAAAFAFLRAKGLRDLPVGRYEIEGDLVYAMVQRGPGRSKDGALLETHNRYIDIQFVLAGTDNMGWKPRCRCTQTAREYEDNSDIAFHGDPPDAWIAVGEGLFVIFFPDDAHLPSISSEEIHKVVVKIAA